MIDIEILSKDIIGNKEPKKVSLSEAWKTLQIIVADLVRKLENIEEKLKGIEKKEAALNIINRVYDTIFLVVDIPLVPNIFESIIHRYTKQLLMIMVSSSIDATVTIFRQTGIFSHNKGGQ